MNYAVINALAELNRQMTEKTAELKDAALTDLLVEFLDFKNLYEKIDIERKNLYHILDSWEKSIIPTRMREEELDLVRVPSVARSFSLQPQLSVSMVSENKNDAIEWIRTNKPYLISETVNSSTLTAEIKRMMNEEGLEPPPDLFNVRTYDRIGITKYTPK